MKKGEYFLKTGRHSERLGFVQTGVIREFVFVNGKEIIKFISTTGYFAVDLACFVFQQPARWNIQAFTDYELFVITHKDYQRIGQVIPRWAELEKLFLANCFMVMEDRILTHLWMTSEERYNQLFSFNTDLFNKVPLPYLAPCWA